VGDEPAAGGRIVALRIQDGEEILSCQGHRFVYLHKMLSVISLSATSIAQTLHVAGEFCTAQRVHLSQERCQLSESLAPLSLEAVEGMLMSPQNGAESVFSVSYQQLLLLCRREQTPIAFAEGSD
jgi:hypothetical protein